MSKAAKHTKAKQAGLFEAKPAKAQQAEPSEDSGGNSDEATAIEEGKLLDYITGEPVADNDKERVRQRIARAFFHEYGISVDDMAPDFPVKAEGRNKKIDIAIFAPGSEHTPENVRRMPRAVSLRGTRWVPYGSSISGSRARTRARRMRETRPRVSSASGS